MLKLFWPLWTFVFIHNVAALTDSCLHLQLLAVLAPPSQIQVTELDLNALLEHFSAIIRQILWCRLQVVQPLLRKHQHGDGQNAHAQFSKPKIQKQAGKPFSSMKWN